MRYKFFLFVGVLLSTCLYTQAQNALTIENVKNEKEFVIATWNIGHFSKGKKKNSTITAVNYDTKLNGFRSIVYDSIAADLLCINEFSLGFGKMDNEIEQASSSVLFNGFETKEAREQMGFCCNAIFSNLTLKHVKRHDFRSSKPYIANEARIANFHYLSGDIYVNGQRIRLVCAHLCPGSKNSELRKKQIMELVDILKKYDKVIICGDFNTNNQSAFKEAGYALANDSKIVTFPSKSYSLDNIIVKGLKVSDVRVIKTALSDHYPVVCKISME